MRGLRWGVAVVAVVAWLLFALLTAAVAWSPPGGLDVSMNAAWFALAADSAVVATVCRVLDWLGGYLVSAVAVAATSVWLMLRGRRLLTVFLVASAIGGIVLADVVKGWADRARPSTVGQIIVETTPSYPSGHATSSIAVWLALAIVFLVVLPKPSRWWVGGALAVFAVLVGLSRIVAGVHWPSDVLGGWLLGIAWSASVGFVTLSVAQRRGYLGENGGAGMRGSLDATVPNRPSSAAQDA